MALFSSACKCVFSTGGVWIMTSEKWRKKTNETPTRLALHGKNVGRMKQLMSPNSQRPQGLQICWSDGLTAQGESTRQLRPPLGPFCIERFRKFFDVISGEITAISLIENAGSGNVASCAKHENRYARRLKTAVSILGHSRSRDIDTACGTLGEPDTRGDERRSDTRN